MQKVTPFYWFLFIQPKIMLQFLSILLQDVTQLDLEKFLLYAFLDLHVSASFIATAVTGKLYQFEVVCEVNMKQLDYGKTHSRFHWRLILMFLRVQEHDIPRAEVVTFNFLFLHVLFGNEKSIFYLFEASFHQIWREHISVKGKENSMNIV